MRLLFLLIIAFGVYSSYYERDLFFMSRFFGSTTSVSTAHAKWLEEPIARNVGKDPIQKKLSGLKSISFGQGKLKLLANYQLTAKILSKKSYSIGKAANLAPR